VSERVVFGFVFDDVAVEQQVAWRDWCRHHGIDPNETGQDAAREVRVVQLEAVPSPFPSFS
jgi:hypothetical protein